MINNKLDKNTMMLEDLNKKIEIVAEVQTAQKEQNERYFTKVQQEQKDKGTLVTAVENYIKLRFSVVLLFLYDSFVLEGKLFTIYNHSFIFLSPMNIHTVLKANITSQA